MKSSKKRPRKSKKGLKGFGEAEFVKSLWKTMKGQEKKNPALALLHERLEGAVQLIGLTGGIASGKSTVAAFFREAKIPVIDADAVAREVVRPKKEAFREIVSAFGEGVISPDGTLNREKLGEIVFSDESKRKLLESITHPEVIQEIAKQVSALKKKKHRLIVVDVPLLFESGLHEQMSKTILVKIDPALQTKRLMGRDQILEIKAWQRILSQMPLAEKEKLAHYIIDNSGTLEETRRQFAGLIVELKNLI